jgi:membrane-bound serine protease (ClpP class)
MSPVYLFFLLLASGLVLLAIEIFMPGGILGVLGGMALFGAIVAGFTAFPGYGLFVAVGIVLLAGLVLVLWIKIFPHTGVGKRMTVATDLADSKAHDPSLQRLLGQVGTAVSDLRPSGYAAIDGLRVDVVTTGGMVAKGTKIRVVEVKGSRIVVAQAPS